MSDAYGTITFSTSANCTINAKDLAEALNQFEWTSSGDKWEFDSYGGKYEIWNTNGSNAQYPTTFPNLIENVTDDDDFEMENVSLQKLSEALSQHVTKGWVEIACCANEKSRYIYFESLRIYANGNAERKAIRSGPMAEPVDFNETYQAPPKITPS